ncbi:MAG: hypothetical protein IMZ54_12590 [Acidobacteria bacterium]|nr:hypothetical protein [Acidobacteriota bacterium]
MPARYGDKNGHELFVSDGLCDGRLFGTFYRKPSGSLRRYTSPALPMQPTAELAQADLDAYARKRGWRLVPVTFFLPTRTTK